MTLEELLPYWPALAGAAALAVCAIAYYLWRKRRPTAAELERRRRLMIDGIGKMGDGTIVEVQQTLVSYNYHVRGIEYLASQDLAGLEEHLPSGQWDTVYAVSVKYDPRNPANSIVLSEKWSGLRKAQKSL